MKAYKLFLVNYMTPVTIIQDGKEIEVEKKYKVRNAIANILCHPTLKLVGYTFYENALLGDKIMNCRDDYITLSQVEYDKVKKVFDKFEGFSRADAELVKRVYEAQQIDKEKE